MDVQDQLDDKGLVEAEDQLEKPDSQETLDHQDPWEKVAPEDEMVRPVNQVAEEPMVNKDRAVFEEQMVLAEPEE